MRIGSRSFRRRGASGCDGAVEAVSGRAGTGSGGGVEGRAGSGRTASKESESIRGIRRGSGARSAPARLPGTGETKRDPHPNLSRKNGRGRKKQGNRATAREQLAAPLIWARQLRQRRRSARRRRD